ncbi:amidohydrolase family protein [Thermodesulfovibrio sp.]|uniref:amidohydrolase family protein n=1 Tax=Thermodesulfovibrio sp. TaxID=2067987 RepID=UPI0030A03CB9
MSIVDFHTHAFPEEIAERAMAKLQENCAVKACLNGTLNALIKSMDKSGVQKAVICNIATKPEQFYSILKWSQKIRSERIIPLLSIHPLDSEIKEHVKIIKEEGFPGIKMHPFYQDFAIDDERIFPLYEELTERQLFIIMHCGYDISFPQWDIASPQRIINVINKFPQLKFITTHLGAWKQWDEVERLMLGKNIYMEISFSFGWLSEHKIKEFLLKHPSDFILFGTDSPWADQSREIENLKSLSLPEELSHKILRKNAEKLLGINDFKNS